jgi:hypothetical protein
MTRFAFAFVTVAAVFAAAPAHAQTNGWLFGQQPSYAPAETASYYQARRAAYDTGYREGIKEGEKDGRRGDPFSYRDERSYQRADKGYHRTYGDVNRYRQSFRDGYEAGYTDAYSRYRRPGSYGRDNGRWNDRGRYPGQGGGYGYGYGTHPAQEHGLREGVEKGREDAEKRRSFDPLRHKWYREGDRHYEGRYGSREQYKDIYRQAFKVGYERGFQEGRYR